MLAIAQYDQAQDCSNYEWTKDELGISKLCNGAANFQLFYLSFSFHSYFLLFKKTICSLSLLFLIQPQDVKHSGKNLQSSLSSNGMLVL
jgi:hypothetical protein